MTTDTILWIVTGATLIVGAITILVWSVKAENVRLRAENVELRHELQVETEAHCLLMQIAKDRIADLESGRRWQLPRKEG